MADAYEVFQYMILAFEKSITQLGGISLFKLQSILQSDEKLIILAHDTTKKICRAVIWCDDYSGPESLDEEVWSPARYRDWKFSYPRAYGDWKPSHDPFTEEQPSKDKVKDSISSLSIGNFESGRLLSIIPDAYLFGFPFALSLKSSVHLGENTEIATAPSVTWLIEKRSKPWSGTLKRKAWLGSPGSTDLTIHYLRDRLCPYLEKYGFEIIESDSPKELAGSNVALVVSHGSIGLFDHFRTLSDGVGDYLPGQLAHSLEGCGCVLLFVCHAGRSDPRWGSSETIGLVSELLKENIRSVVASPWPLHGDVAAIWLSSFLETLSNGHSVGHSAHVASSKIRAVYDNPCAWAALQVYGDATFKPIMERT